MFQTICDILALIAYAGGIVSFVFFVTAVVSVLTENVKPPRGPNGFT